MLFASAATADVKTSVFLKNNSTTSSTISLNGKWHRKHFKACKAFAEKNGVPLIAVWSNGDACPHCTKFEDACNSTVFRNSMKASGCVFYFTYPGDGAEGKMGDENDVFKWIRQSQTSFPFIRVYWSVKGKKKVDLTTIGDDVDGNAKGSAGGKAAMNYFKKVLKAYKYTPAPVVPKYTGGAFNVGDADGDRLEAEVGVTEWVDVPIARTSASAVSVASTNSLEVVYPDGSAVTNTIDWAKGDSTVEVRTSATHILFNTGSIQVISKLYEGPYPSYRSVIPQQFERTAQANTTEFQNKIRSVISMANARTRKIRLQFDGNILELSATDPDVGGDSREALAITHNGEGSFCIGFNGQFLAEILGMCKSEEVIMKMNNPLGACIIEPVGENMNFSFLLMPTHLTDN